MGNSFAAEGNVAIRREEREEAKVVPPGPPPDEVSLFGEGKDVVVIGSHSSRYAL